MKLFTKNDHIIESVLSSFRWIFLLIACGYYYFYLKSNNDAFLSLLLFGLVYMTVAELALHKTPLNSKRYRFMTKFSVAFDYVAFLWLVFLTGGAESPLFPIAYLIILHVAVYWRFSGGVLASILLGVGYTVVLILKGYSFQGDQLVTYLLDFMFLLFMGLLGGIIVSRERTMRTKNTKLEDMARKDFLTDLYNHRSFQEDLLTYSQGKKPLMLVLADIDYFKSVNDRFGHMTGDNVLRKICFLIKEEIAGNGRAYRYGGEELAILLKANDEEDAKKCLLRIQSAIRELTYTVDDESFQVTLSYGTALFPLEDHIEDCLRIADARLYRAKRMGRDQICWYDQCLEGHAR
ncbi:GGDEF domain-containing protein [Pseudalkalibacillus hwajinpoensis]|uniref:GGDEF domain-containing protein n=1 Tax=Guptibacillus hwajinpoensis TaxID=208199 RepID=UPI00325B6396